MINTELTTGKKLLEQQFSNFTQIEPSLQILMLYNKIKLSLDEYLVVGHFYQLKKNEKGEGLAFELMFFDNILIYDLVISKNTIDFSTAILKNVTMISLDTVFTEERNENDTVPVKESIELKLLNAGGIPSMSYITDIKRFDELLEIKSTLQKILIS